MTPVLSSPDFWFPQNPTSRIMSSDQLSTCAAYSNGFTDSPEQVSTGISGMTSFSTFWGDAPCVVMNVLISVPWLVPHSILVLSGRNVLNSSCPLIRGFHKTQWLPGTGSRLLSWGDQLNMLPRGLRCEANWMLLVQIERLAVFASHAIHMEVV